MWQSEMSREEWNVRVPAGIYVWTRICYSHSSRSMTSPTARFLHVYSRNNSLYSPLDHYVGLLWLFYLASSHIPS